MTRAKLYKIVMPDGSACHGGTGKWHLPTRGRPGKWMSLIDNIEPCWRGYHVLRPEHVMGWLKEGAALYECEADPKAERIVEDDKIVVGRARLTRLVSIMTDRALREFACDAAEHVLPIFEKADPKDNRPRRAIAAARAWLANPTPENAAARAAAGDAAWAAARAAAGDAARDAAWDAAGDAAWAAAWAAARAAARAAAGDAAQKKVAPVVQPLQASAFDLLDRMIAGQP